LIYNVSFFFIDHSAHGHSFSTISQMQFNLGIAK